MSVLLMGQPNEGSSGMMNIIMFALIFVVFYFFMIRPQQKKAKDQKKFIDGIQKGDKIVTTGGIHAKVAELKAETLIVELEGGQRMKIEKSAISLELSQSIKKEEA